MIQHTENMAVGASIINTTKTGNMEATMIVTGKEKEVIMDLKVLGFKKD